MNKTLKYRLLRHLPGAIGHHYESKYKQVVATNRAELLYNQYKRYGRDHHFRKSSPQWLIHREVLYGGIHTNIPVGSVSPHDPRTPAELQTDRMRGGDRMLHHGYAGKYSEYLERFDHDRRLVIAEFGILRGNGLAIWCDLFPNSRILGFDIDIAHFENNKPHLLNRGAFSHNIPEIHEYDQYVRNDDLLASILHGDTIDICIDDGCHTDEAIMSTMTCVMPHMSGKFAYFVEDNGLVHKKISREFPTMNVDSHGQLTVVTRTAKIDNPQ